MNRNDKLYLVISNGGRSVLPSRLYPDDRMSDSLREELFLGSVFHLGLTLEDFDREIDSIDGLYFSKRLAQKHLTIAQEVSDREFGIGAYTHRIVEINRYEQKM